MASIYVGTSGYAYREWLGHFYPEGTKPGAMLSFYARHFNTVEINNTFYQLPAVEKMQAWKDSVGPEFRFAVKAHQAITHRRDFGIPGGQLAAFLGRLVGLGEKLGPVLFQFPPTLGDAGSLIEFLNHLHLLSGRFPVTPVVEVRHPKLLTPDFFAVLHDQRVELCCNDEQLASDRWPQPRTFAYLRLRREHYSGDNLREIADRLRAWGRESYVFFKHETSAPDLAQRLRTVAGKE